MIHVVLGTRPEVIKLAPVIRALREGADAVETRVVFTSQHRDMAAAVAAALALSPDVDLDLMTPGQSPSDVLSRTLAALDPMLAADRPALVMVQGDTTTALAAAIAAFHRRIPMAHVEAGLRTPWPDNPFPEEMNRRLISRLATLHFAATEANHAALLHEGVSKETVHVTGNTVIDALEWIVAVRADAVPAIARDIERRDHRIVLATTHRRENFGEAQRNILRAISRLVEMHEDIEVVLPVHPNPAVVEAVDRHLPQHERIHRIAPLGYPEFVHLLARAYMALTDSGGIQEEGPALGVPVLVLRTTTERPELIECGSGLLVGVDYENIVAAAGAVLSDPARHAAMAVRRFPFGRGGAASRIAAITRAWLAHRASV